MGVLTPNATHVAREKWVGAETGWRSGKWAGSGTWERWIE